MKQNAKRDQMSQVKFDDFESYHMHVMSSIQTIIDTINYEFQDVEFDRGFTITNDLQSLSNKSQVNQMMNMSKMKTMASTVRRRQELNRRATFVKGSKL